MIRYLEAIETLPSEIKLPLIKVFELFKEEIAETVKRSDFEELEVVVRELAEAQKRAKQRLAKLIGEVEDIEGLPHTVGYRLKDETFKALPELLKRDFNIEVVGRLEREFVEIGKNRYIDVNIWGKEKKNGKEYVII